VCGIAGAVGPSDGSATIEQLTLALRHRGPDGVGWARAGAADLGSTRLAIIDPAADAQLLYDETASACLVFNGEIYNHRELRTELIARGHRFRTRTDSEVVIHLYEEMGRACVTRLRGMFAFAVSTRSQVLLARDRLGIKPLYWTADPATGRVLFASEVKALLAALPGQPRLHLQAFADSVALGHLVGTSTLFEGVQTVPAGTTMCVHVEAAGVRIEDPAPYVTSVARDDTMSYEDAEEFVAVTFEDAVRRHLDADVEVAFTLSGGIDSTLLALFAAEQTDEPLRTYTVADHADYPDVRQAEAVAKLLGSDHRTTILNRDDFLDAVPRLVRAEEGPASLFGLPFQVLCERIGEDVKACMHGEGADEVFGGYVEYLARDHRAEAFKRALPRLKSLGIPPSDAAIETMLRLTSARTMAQHLEAVFAVNLGDPLQRLHLDGIDRCAMSAGVEMRVPYLDDELTALATRIPLRHLVRWDIGVRKYLLRRLALRRFGAAYGPVVLDVVLREKLGAPSSGVRLLQDFEVECDRRLPADYLDRHELGAAFRTKRQLLMFEYFCTAFLDHRGDVDAVGGILDFLESREG
jgi:asparagine synthase (glutamine-hydrolysing)